jgi:hypothetical protein
MGEYVPVSAALDALIAVFFVKTANFLMFSFTTENALLTHLYKVFWELLSIFRKNRHYNGSLLTHFYMKTP